MSIILIGFITNIGGCGDGHATSEGHVPGEVGGVRGAGIQHISDTDRVDLLGLEADAGHGGVRGEHLEVHGAVGLKGAPECAEGGPLGCYNKHSPGQNVSCGHLVLIEEVGLK